MEWTMHLQLQIQTPLDILDRTNYRWIMW